MNSLYEWFVVNLALQYKNNEKPRSEGETSRDKIIQIERVCFGFLAPRKYFSLSEILSRKSR